MTKSFEMEQLSAGFQEALKLENLPTAMLICERLFELDPDLAETYRVVGNGFRIAGLLEYAESIFREGYKRCPFDPALAADHAWIAHERRDFGEASRRWSVLRLNFPDNVCGYAGAAATLREAGNLNGALFAAEEAIARFPNHGAPQIERARIAYAFGDHAEAILRWELIRKFFPEEPAGYEEGIRALRAAGRGEDADALSSLWSDQLSEKRRVMATSEMPDLPSGFCHDTPSNESAIAIFDNWTSSLPIPDARGGTVPLFSVELDPRPSFVTRIFGEINQFDVLELGSFEGGHTYQLERLGARSILGIEANAESFLKSPIIKEVLGLKARFLHGDFVKYLESAGTTYDLIFACGVLYHMTDPLHLLHLIAEHTPRTFLWTHYVSGEWEGASFDVARYGVSARYYRYDYEPAVHSRHYSGTDTYCCRLLKDDILRALATYGFTEIHVMNDEPDGVGGPNMSLVASREPG